MVPKPDVLERALGGVAGQVGGAENLLKWSAWRWSTT
jgi:hypothetical protein